MARQLRSLALGLPLAALAWLPCPARASSHMDAPLITLDDPANTTDVYAFVSERGGRKYLSTALAVYPFEEPGIGPNAYQFDDNVRYEIHVATGGGLASGMPALSYRFRFDTRFKNRGTILQSYLGPIQTVDDANQNRTQTYTVTKVFEASASETAMRGTPAPDDGVARVTATSSTTLLSPPNNQGRATPFYNRNAGEGVARDGVNRNADLDRYTRATVFDLSDGSRVFAGQRDDGFYADIQGIFDFLNFTGPNKPFDSQGGFNVHTIALDIPVSQLGGDQQVVGVYATTSRRRITVLSAEDGPATSGEWVQVGRQGNPLFNEALVAIRDKDLYNRTSPSLDAALFRSYALNPELARLINLILNPSPAAPETNRTDIAGIFIPDLIKVDLSTGPARLAGNPNDNGFSRLGIFGGDVLQSDVQDPFGNGGFIPGGWPNGRRFGDDVVDTAVCALLSDLRGPLRIACDGTANIDRVTRNDITYNKVFPYAATPLNGRNHEHH